MADAILSGTGFEGRDSNIRRYCKNNMAVTFKRHKDNSFDPNAIAVYLLIPVLFGLLGKRKVSIGWLKKPLAGGCS